MENNNVQTMPQTNQIESQKPNVPKTTTPITGEIGCSMNGGHNKVIHWQYVMAGQYIEKGYLNLNIQMLTPKTPAYQRLKAKAMLIYVPHERVMKKYLEYIGQRGGTTVQKIEKKPNFGGKLIPKIYDPETLIGDLLITNTTAWRDHWISAYIPRIGSNYIGSLPNALTEEIRRMPEYDALPARAYVAAYNDVIRNREYEAPLPEFIEMTQVTDQEWNSYMPNPINEDATIDQQQGRCRRNTSYYTDYRTELQGLDLETPSVSEGDRAMMEWSSWESKFDLARTNAENAQKRDIDILAEIRGSKRLSEGRVQIIGQETFDINYSAITQSAYNTNEDIEPKFQVMGQQGAYSYTNVSIPIGKDVMFLSDGTLHLILTITADTVFETGLYRRALNVNAIDEYRPELEDDKLDVIYECEFGTTYEAIYPEVINYKKIRGYKRRFSEIFKGNNVIQGDMTTNNLIQLKTTGTAQWQATAIEVETNKTYQFYETSSEWAYVYKSNFNGTIQLETVKKKVYYDYTDIAIDENQAIMNGVGITADYTGEKSIYVGGQNQIFMVGNYTIFTTVPVSEKIKNNYSEWGEH